MPTDTPSASTALSASAFVDVSLLAALPALSEAAAPSSLAPLKTERLLLPDLPSVRTKAIAFCKRIRRVKIQESVKINGHSHYVVKMFYEKASSHIPTVAQGLDSAEWALSDEPDLVFHQRFSQFVNLRHEMYFHAHVGHGRRPCEFCAGFTALLEDGQTLPRMRLKLFHGDASICEALQGFVNSTLELTHTLQTTSLGRLCDGQKEIPLLVKQFLSECTEGKLPVPPQQDQPRLNFTDRRAKYTTAWSAM